MKHRPLSRIAQSKLDSAFLRAFRVDAHGDQKGRCAYCRSPLTYRRTTADHVRARHQNGRDERNNIVAACEPCNRLKGHMPAVLFRKMITDPRPGGPLAFLLVNVTLRLNLRIERMERRIARAVGVKELT